MTANAGKCAGSPLRKRSLWVGPCACPVRCLGEVESCAKNLYRSRRGAGGAFTAPNPSIRRPSTSSGQALRRRLGVRSVGGLRGFAGRGRYEGALPHSEQARLRAVSRESRDVIRLPDGVAGSEARRKGPGPIRRAPRRHLPGMFAGPDLGIAHAYVVSEFPSLPVACSFLAHALAVKIVRARIHRSSAYLPIGVRSHTLQVSYIPRARTGRRPLLAAGVALPCSRRSSKSVVPPDPYSKQP